MAPLSSGAFTDAVGRARTHLESRGLGGNNTSPAPSLSDGQKNILQTLAVTFSTISVASSLLTFYWFMKMRRSFRHDLIMLLIQSDMFKALWFMIYPIVVFTTGPVRDTSAFCQVNGFMIALGIEASDFSVLMIAIHSALYIFGPRSSSGEGGLYPYRQIAYTLWAIFPLLMASLAFINGRHAYVSEGTYCYLPVRPFWYRLALDWIPRYIIFMFILVIYVSIYYYVRFKFQGFNDLSKKNKSERVDSSLESIDQPPRRLKHETTVPSTPTLALHGLIPGSRQSTMTEHAARKPSISTLDSHNADQRAPMRQTGGHRFMWQSFSAPDNGSPPSTSEDSLEDDSFDGPSAPQPLPPTFPEPISPRSDSLNELPSRDTSWRDSFVDRFSPHNISDNTITQHSVVNIHTFLRRHPDQSECLTPISQLRLTNAQGQTIADAEMHRTRDKIRRQLRFLFIYPLVYIGMWILPFVSHGMQYSDRFVTDPPFALTCCTTVSICMQAAVDAWLFSTREKPWRHIPGTSGGFWVSLKFWSDWTGFRRRSIVQGPGKTREEMVHEARAAYRRRDEEILQRRKQVDGSYVGHQRELGAKRAEWWENLGVDGAMSPVHEEGNSMEVAVVFNEDTFFVGGNTLKASQTKALKEKDEKAPDDREGIMSLNSPVVQSPFESAFSKANSKDMDQKRFKKEEKNCA
ncbi:related to G protein-coupled receptor [Rhynchosporium graminicola]|uniref:Related to G protein-coupled receptor n=1 Tax=Rhynchosporium graminicola TaxID=2792576 RepID=A0A1E1JS19_9HELO|nr:related to G protein-coupled receptor [Rhynchosporium commune]